jgi:hypothetical protein
MNSLNSNLDRIFPPYFYYLLHLPIVSGALAGSGACLVSTPSEVVKTRLQLQGELSAGKKVYSGRIFVEFIPSHSLGFLHGLFTILKHEGLSGIYSGIAPAIYYQVCFTRSNYLSVTISTSFIVVGRYEWN